MCHERTKACPPEKDGRKPVEASLRRQALNRSLLLRLNERGDARERKSHPVRMKLNRLFFDDAGWRKSSQHGLTTQSAIRRIEKGTFCDKHMTVMEQSEGALWVELTSSRPDTSRQIKSQPAHKTHHPPGAPCHQPIRLSRSISAYAEWLWIDSKFSASSV